MTFQLSSIQHVLDDNICRELGPYTAIVFNHISRFIQMNMYNGVNDIEGRTWTYQTQEEILEYLPFLSIDIIHDSLHKLLDKGLILRERYHGKVFGRYTDRTCWYALANENMIAMKRKNKKISTKLSDFQVDNRQNSKMYRNIQDKRKNELPKESDKEKISPKDSLASSSARSTEHQKLMTEIDRHKLSIKPQVVMRWLKSHTYEKLVKVLGMLVEKKFKQSKLKDPIPIRNPEAWVENALKVSFEFDDKSTRNNQIAIEFKKKHNWHDLKILKTVCKCELSHESLSFSVDEKLFDKNLEHLHRKYLNLRGEA